MLEACTEELSTIDLGGSEFSPASKRGTAISPRTVSKAERMAQERELLNAMAAAKAEDLDGGAPEEAVFTEWQAIANSDAPDRNRCWELLLGGGLPRELRSCLWLQLSGATEKEQEQQMTYDMVKTYLGDRASHGPDPASPD